MKTTLPPELTKKLPIITITIATCSALISLTPMNQILQYDRAAVTAGHFWLLLTGHLSHWSAENLFWDLFVFVILGVMAERISRRGFLFCLAGSVALISALLLFWLQDMDCYRGLSGLDSALFGFTALWMVKERIASGDYREAGLIIGASATFLFKIIYESYTLETVFTNSADLFQPVPLAHLAGGFIGIVVFLVLWRSTPVLQE